MFVYAGFAKALVRSFKFEGKRAAAVELAERMELLHVTPQTIVVHIPTVPARVRERGYDHALLLAKAVAARHGLVQMTLLARATAARQVGAARRDRLANMAGAFRVVSTVPRNAHILLVDDVVTTGATLGEAAAALRAAGAQRVDALTFARTPAPTTPSAQQS